MPAATMTRMELDSWPPRPAGMWKPWVTRNATSDIQKITLSTTADPIPWVPRANPASDPLTPDWVRRR